MSKRRHPIINQGAGQNVPSLYKKRNMEQDQQTMEEYLLSQLDTPVIFKDGSVMHDQMRDRFND